MGHDHNHAHSITNYNRAFALGILLNVVFTVIEFTYGFLSDSLALVADAGHNLSDVMSLLLAWGANILAGQIATKSRTYGYRKATILASLISALLLFAAVGAIAWEAVSRFQDPRTVTALPMIIVAAIGVVINTLTALLFVRGQKHDLNLRGAFLHMAADAAVSLGVVVAGVGIMLTHWQWIDPVISLVIVAVIVIGTWGLLKESLYYVMDFVPGTIDINAIQQYLLNLERVESLHDLHVWPLSTTETALTVHLVVNTQGIDNNFLDDVARQLHDVYQIGHPTIQIETQSESVQCRLINNC